MLIFLGHLAVGQKLMRSLPATIFLGLSLISCSHGLGRQEPDFSIAPVESFDGEQDLALFEPVNGTYLGANIEWAYDSAADFNQRLGMNAAVFVQFLQFPLNSDTSIYLEQFLGQVLEVKAIALLTLEPVEGLEQVTPASLAPLTDILARFNQQGVPIIIRFAHEMNGSWYAWSQQPTLYIEKFRLVADTVREQTSLTALLWAPNYGGGYPFSGGRFEIERSHPDFEVLDTNGDGQLDTSDDMYAPYYPGDDYVDWVGLSIYHWGNAYPWGENEIPEEKKFINMIRGNYNGLIGNESNLPDFYLDYVIHHNKPMAITETAALYNREGEGDGEAEIKLRWVEQVFSEEVFDQFPRLKMINWFDVQKNESEIGGSFIDWSVTFSSEIRSNFVERLPTGRLIFADEIKFPPVEFNREDG